MRHILLYDFPKIVSSDQGKHFRNELMEELCKLLGIKQNLHVAFRPQSTGCLERQHRVLKSALYGMSLEQNQCWELILPSVVSMMNKSKNAATGMSPHQVLFGRKPSFQGIQLAENPASKSPVSYSKQVAETLARAKKFINICQQEADFATKEAGKSNIKPMIIEKGDRCLLKREMSAETKINKNPWIGPFDCLNSNGVILQLDIRGTPTWVHRHHCILYKSRPPELDPELCEQIQDSEAEPEKQPEKRYPTRQRKPPDFLVPGSS